MSGFSPDSTRTRWSAWCWLIQRRTRERFLGLSLTELHSLSGTLEQARASPIPTGIQVFLIDALLPEVPFATQSMREIHAKRRRQLPAESLAYEEWLNGVPGGRLIVTDRSGHNVPHEEPKLVVETIRRVVEPLPQ